jgi:hypothetical protein
MTVPTLIPHEQDNLEEWAMTLKHSPAYTQLYQVRVPVSA